MDKEKDARTRLAVLECVKLTWGAAPARGEVDLAAITANDFGEVSGLTSGLTAVETTFAENRFQYRGALLAVVLGYRHDSETRGVLESPRIRVEIAGQKVFDDDVGRIIEKRLFNAGDPVRILAEPPPSLRELEILLLGYEFAMPAGGAEVIA